MQARKLARRTASSGSHSSCTATVKRHAVYLTKRLCLAPYFLATPLVDKARQSLDFFFPLLFCRHFDFFPVVILQKLQHVINLLQAFFMGIVLKNVRKEPKRR